MNLYRLAVFLGDAFNTLFPVRAAQRAERMADALAKAEELQEVWEPASTIRDVCDRLDDIRNLLLHLSARPSLARVDCADTPPAANPPCGGGGHPASPDTSPDIHSHGWSGVGPGGGDSTAPPGQPDRPLSELLNHAAHELAWLYGLFDIYVKHPRTLIFELRDAAAQMAAVESEPL